MSEKNKYAEEWDVSAKFFYEQNVYDKLCTEISKYHVVLEVGCGTGYSTLMLVESGHKVISIEKNEVCIAKTKKLLEKHSIVIGNDITDINNNQVILLQCDIVKEMFFTEVLPKLNFDIVVCWNVGTDWTSNTIRNYFPEMLQYGLKPDQIMQNKESSYSELIIWNAAKCANLKHVPVQLGERGLFELNENAEIYAYYCGLKDEFGYECIEIKNYKIESLSSGGKTLGVNEEVFNQEKVQLILSSILLY